MGFENNTVYLLYEPFQGSFLATKYRDRVISIEMTTFDIYDADQDDIEYWESECDIQECCEEFSNLIIKQLENMEVV